MTLTPVAIASCKNIGLIQANVAKYLEGQPAYRRVIGSIPNPYLGCKFYLQS